MKNEKNLFRRPSSARIFSTIFGARPRPIRPRQFRRVLGLGVSLERAAELLGVTGVTLLRKRKELGLP